MNIIIIDRLLAISTAFVALSFIIKFKMADNCVQIPRINIPFQEQNAFILKVIKAHWFLFIVVPIIILVLRMILLIIRITPYGGIAFDQTTKYIFKSVVDLTDLKDILTYIYIKLSDNINGIRSIYSRFSLAIYLLYPVIIFYRINSQKKKRILEFSLIVAAFFFLIISAYTGCQVSNIINTLLFNVLMLPLQILSIYLFSYLYPLLYIPLLEGYLENRISFLDGIEIIHKKRLKIFISLFVVTLSNNIEYYIGIFIPGFEMVMINLYTVLNIIVTMFFLIMLPRLMLLNNDFLREIRETKNYIMNNLAIISKKFIFYTVIYLILNYFLGSIRFRNGNPGYHLIIDNFLRFIILYPISIYAYFDFNYTIIKTSINELQIEGVE